MLDSDILRLGLQRQESRVPRNFALYGVMMCERGLETFLGERIVFSGLTKGASMDIFAGMFACAMSSGAAHVLGKAVWLPRRGANDAVVAKSGCDRFSILKGRFGTFSSAVTWSGANESR